MTIVSTVASASAPGERQVAALVDGAEIQIPCPKWCTKDHIAEGEKFLADVDHSSTPHSLPTPVGVGNWREDILMGWVSQYPFVRQDAGRGPVFVLDATGSGDCAELSVTEATAYLDQLAAHVETLRGMARRIGGAS